MSRTNSWLTCMITHDPEHDVVEGLVCWAILILQQQWHTKLSAKCHSTGSKALHWLVMVYKPYGRVLVH